MAMTPLTKSKLKKLAAKLIDTRLNIYTVCRDLFKLEDIDDAVFDQLKEAEEIFRCEQCSAWLPLECRDNNYGPDVDMCEECSGEEY